jgi:hypothetical protein
MASAALGATVIMIPNSESAQARPAETSLVRSGIRPL